MKKYSTLVLGINYKGVENYIIDYIKSILEQNTNQFDLLIINDNTAPIELGGMNVNVYEITITEKKTPGMIRYDGLKYALSNNYTNLIFSDLDDYFSKNRISLTKKALINNDFAFNNLTLINHNGEIVQNNYFEQLSTNKDICSFTKITNYNFIGLSNSGINIKSFEKFYIPEDIIAVDWWIYTILLLKGSSGKYINNATTYYRQTIDNLVGMKKLLNDERLETGIKVKKIHYNHVIEYCRNNNLHTALRDYSKINEGIMELELALQDKDIKLRYIDKINSSMDTIYHGWWSEIIDLKTWETYAN